MYFLKSYDSFPSSNATQWDFTRAFPERTNYSVQNHQASHTNVPHFLDRVIVIFSLYLNDIIVRIITLSMADWTPVQRLRSQWRSMDARTISIDHCIFIINIRYDLYRRYNHFSLSVEKCCDEPYYRNFCGPIFIILPEKLQVN